LIARFGNEQVLAKLLEMFTSPEVIEMFLSLNKWNQNVFHSNSKSFLKTIFDLARNFPSDKLRKALKTSETDGWNLMHYSACNKENQVTCFVFEFVSKILGIETAIKMLKEAEWEDSRTILHLLAKYGKTENFYQLLSLVINHLTVDEVQELLRAKKQKRRKHAANCKHV
jgi:hypothetical protein